MNLQSASTRWLLIRRGFALLFGVTYVIAATASLTALTTMHFGIAAVVVVLAVTIQMLIMLVLASRFIRPNRKERQIGLTSIMLIIVAMSIYFAAIGLFLRKIQELDGVTINDPGVITAIFLISVCFIGLSTVILLHLADTLMWLAVHIVRWRRLTNLRRQRKHKSIADGSRLPVAESSKSRGNGP